MESFRLYAFFPLASVLHYAEIVQSISVSTEFERTNRRKWLSSSCFICGFLRLAPRRAKEGSFTEVPAAHFSVLRVNRITRLRATFDSVVYPEVLEDQNSLMDNQKKKDELKELCDADSTESEVQLDFAKLSNKSPLTLDIIDSSKSCRCHQESCPCNSELDLSSSVSFVNCNENHLPHTITSREFTNPLSLNLLYRTVSLFSFPFKLRLSELVFNLMYNKNTSGTHKPDGIFSVFSPMDGTWSVVQSSSLGLKLFELMGNAKASAPLKSSLVFDLGIVHDVANETRSRSPSPACREYNRSSLSVGKNLPENSEAQMTPVVEQRSEIELRGMKLGSYQSTNSFQCTSYSECSITRGQLQCLPKSGMLYFTFSVDGTPQEIYTAYPQKIAHNAMDYLYSFHLRTDGKTNNSRKQCLNSSHLIAKMKVSNSILLKPTGSKIKETEFILYGSQEKHSGELQKSSAIARRSRGFSNKVAEIFRSNNMVNGKEEDNCLEKLGGFNGFTLSNYRDDLIPNLELAAIVVEECLQDSTSDLMVGGWGLKFLQKAGQTDASSEHSLPQRCSENSYSNRVDSARSMCVLIPADLHGGPVSKVGGPASLTDRWRSGGQCDCSGWDIGCPLKVLKNTFICSTVSPNDTGNCCNSVNLFMEDTKNMGKPTLSIVNRREGLYSICFNSSLSPLQSFSIAVAVIHTEMPGLCPEL